MSEQSPSGIPVIPPNLSIILSQRFVIGIPASVLLKTMKKDLTHFLTEDNHEFYLLTEVFSLTVAKQRVSKANTTAFLKPSTCRSKSHVRHTRHKHATNLLSSSYLKEVQSFLLGFLKNTLDNTSLEIQNTMYL